MKLIYYVYFIIAIYWQIICWITYISNFINTPLLEAASNSITSIKLFLLIETQFSHSLHGLKSNGFLQFKALAKILAVVVFPVPRGPEKKCMHEKFHLFFKGIIKILNNMRLTNYIFKIPRPIFSIQITIHKSTSKNWNIHTIIFFEKKFRRSLL